MDQAARPLEYKSDSFQPDPSYGDRVYRPDEQLEIYGGKHKNSEPYYPLLFGRPMYGYGPLDEGINIFGSRNLAFPRLMLFGDWRNVVSQSKDKVKEIGEANSRLNLDIDLNLTATERVHAFTRPFDDAGNFTGCTFGPAGDEKCRFRGDFKLDALFFEGDVGNIVSGITGKENHIDLPIAAGLMPFILHNGIWVNDIFEGVAVSLPAMNSRVFDVSNMDLTLFWAFKEVNTPVQNPLRNDEAKIYGANLFADVWSGHLELGYGFTEDVSANKSSFHSTALSFTHRWKDIASFSQRVLTNFGQKPGLQNNRITSNGMLLLLESSWMTRQPYTFVPYLNLFGGFNKPQGLAKQNGILENTGILFEGDGVTSFPFLENSANDTFGGSAGVEYLFNLDKQIVFELSTVQIIGGGFQPGRTEKQDEYGSAVRFQLPLTKALIWRSDAMFGYRPEQRNIYGMRTELRLKF